MFYEDYQLTKVELLLDYTVADCYVEIVREDRERSVEQCLPG